MRSYIRHIKPEAFVDSNGGLFEGQPTPPRFDLPLKLENRGITPAKKQGPTEAGKAWYQQLLWSKATIAKNTIAAKLREAGQTDLAATLEKCHSYFTIAQCKGCRKVNKFPNRCEMKWCPECMSRLAADREKAVGWWVQEIQQPKLMTLTVKNFPGITRGHVDEFQKWWTNLRSRVFAKNWKGGFYSLEVTKEGPNWHLHLHALIDARWIDQFELSQQWREVTNGQGYIVKVDDAREEDYKRHVKKYVIKGTQMATWSPAEIAEFAQAFDGKRCFGVFGSLYGKRTEFSEWWKQIRSSKPVCECGCCEAYYFSEAEFLEQDLQPEANAIAIPPPTQIEHPEFEALVSVAFPK